MPEKNSVIVATDGSDHSLRVLPHANLLASSIGAGIELVRVVERADIDEDGDDDASFERARARLEGALTADLQRFGIKGDVQVVIAPKGVDPAKMLLGLGSRGALLAMHSRGRGGIARILQGSVALGVLKEVTQPVMLGGPDLLPPPAGSGAYRLVVTTDLSPDADYVLRGIAPWLEQGKFEVTMVYIHLHGNRRLRGVFQTRGGARGNTPRAGHARSQA